MGRVLRRLGPGRTSVSGTRETVREIWYAIGFVKVCGEERCRARILGGGSEVWEFVVSVSSPRLVGDLV
jgi:hypothetical protein